MPSNKYFNVSCFLIKRICNFVWIVSLFFSIRRQNVNKWMFNFGAPIASTNRRPHKWTERTIEQNGNNLLMVRTRMIFYVEKEREQLAEKKSFFRFSLWLYLKNCTGTRAVARLCECTCVAARARVHVCGGLWICQAAHTLLRHTNAVARLQQVCVSWGMLHGRSSESVCISMKWAVKLLVCILSATRYIRMISLPISYRRMDRATTGASIKTYKIHWKYTINFIVAIFSEFAPHKFTHPKVQLIQFYD